MDWQPIGTAPKDGSAIIISTKSHSNNVVIAQFIASVPFPTWMDDFGDSYEDATHWMQLPKPPVQS